MRATRHETIGIKQAIRFEWMQKVINLLLSGLDSKSIRQELHAFLSDKKGNGSLGERSKETREFAVNNLMRIWVEPDSQLIPFRDAALEYLREHPDMALPIHWGMFSVAYPFWFTVARQTGRLLSLQSRVAHAQIVDRLKEQYGDRQTVSRYARYVIRSFVIWGVLKDSSMKGCYEKGQSISITEPHLICLMIESALLSISDARATLRIILNNPAFFPFQFSSIGGDVIAQWCNRIEVTRFGFDEDLLKLKEGFA